MSLPRQHASKHLLLLGRETSFTITTAEHYPNANVLLCFYEFASHTHTRPTPMRVSVCAFSAFGAGGTSRSSEKRGVVVLTPNNVTIVAPRCRHSRRQPQCLQERLRNCLNGTMNGPLSAGLMSEEQPWRLSHTLAHKDTHTVVTSTHPWDAFGRVEARLKHYGCVSYRLH